MKLNKVINPGYRRKLSIISDWPLDIRPDGQYLGGEVIKGDSSAPTIINSSTNGGTVWINGDGSIGAKTIRIIADGHVGTGEVGIGLDVEYEIANPDATTLVGTEDVIDEPIPGSTPPV